MVSQDSVHLLVHTPVSRVNILCHRSISCVHTLVHIAHVYNSTIERCTGGARNKPSHWACTPCHKQHTSIGLLAYMLYPMCIYNSLPPSSLPATKCIHLPLSSAITHSLSHSLNLSLSLSHSLSLSFSPPLPSFPSPTLYSSKSSHVYKRAIISLGAYCTYPHTHHRGEFYKHTHIRVGGGDNAVCVSAPIMHILDPLC